MSKHEVSAQFADPAGVELDAADPLAATLEHYRAEQAALFAKRSAAARRGWETRRRGLEEEQRLCCTTQRSRFFYYNRG